MAMQKIKQEPILYIQQPEFNKPNIKMQAIFVARNSKGRILNERIDNPEEKEYQNRKETIVDTNDEVVEVMILSEINGTQVERYEQSSEQIQAIIEAYDAYFVETLQQLSTGYQIDKRKFFREMTIPERIQYLVNFPKEVPPVTCLYLTKDQLVRGFLINKNDECIEIKQLNQSIIKLKIRDITEIKMLGF
ncbi:CotO family spore coat protein [Cytobacillus sp. Hz8]|uniref:CotO family spore coat protein n=1 Tax=Cytobacillus sp. Hz8 TaxID=3347168 RepID=UPI0035DB9D3B